MKEQLLHRILTKVIASIWLISGLVCKVLNLVPRHQEIVAEILSQEHARILTLLIGISEIIMAIWILSRYQTKINAVTQIVIVATMNILEFLLVPNLLLWESMNSLFAFMFVTIVWYTEFKLNKKH